MSPDPASCSASGTTPATGSATSASARVGTGPLATLSPGRASVLVALVLAIVASTFWAPPADAARRPVATRVTGWSTSQLVVEPGATVRLRVGVRPASRRVHRTVRLQWRADGDTAWRTIAQARTDRRGVARLQLRPSAGTVSQVRIAVPRTRRATATFTAPRTVRVLAPTGSGETAPVGTTTTPTEFEAEVLRLTNQARQVARACGDKGRFAAAGPVVAQPTLTSVSRAYSQRMGRERFFDHRDPDGKMPWDRARAAGYHANGIGENIAAGYRTPEDVVAAWLKSPGHCANLMGPRWTEMGVGHRVVEDSPYGHYWTQMFGTGGARR